MPGRTCTITTYIQRFGQCDNPANLGPRLHSPGNIQSPSPVNGAGRSLGNDMESKRHQRGLLALGGAHPRLSPNATPVRHPPGRVPRQLPPRLHVHPVKGGPSQRLYIPNMVHVASDPRQYPPAISARKQERKKNKKTKTTTRAEAGGVQLLLCSESRSFFCLPSGGLWSVTR